MSGAIRKQEVISADPARIGELLGQACGARVRLLAYPRGAPIRHVRHDAGAFRISETTVPGYFSYACEPVNTVVVTEVTAARLRLTCGRGAEPLAAGRPILGARCGVTQVLETRDAHIRQLTIGAELIDKVVATNGQSSIEFRGLQPPTEKLSRLWRHTA